MLGTPALSYIKLALLVLLHSFQISLALTTPISTDGTGGPHYHILVPRSHVEVDINIIDQSLNPSQVDILLALALEDCRLGKTTYGRNTRLPGRYSHFDTRLPFGLNLHAQAVEGRVLTWGVLCYAVEGLQIFESRMREESAISFDILSLGDCVGRGNIGIPGPALLRGNEI